ncbi:MAG: DUF4387 domain-containing protein [Ruminococcaceae bacterium]|nr:DUF4387 domain-containing protein [Oscillospiraceae bacterium]
MTYRLRDLASVIRSKNSGPYELTLDVLFKEQSDFERVVAAGVINRELIMKLYSVKAEDVMDIIAFPQAKAIKATIVRPMPSGALGERDVYGAQQHAPLMNLVIELP